MELLGLTYDPIYLDFDKIKSPEHMKYNPNGHIPTLIDHRSGDFIIWEFDAIILYLVEKYDLEYKISVSSLEKRAILNQWLFFQASGQGPYFGQALWFGTYRPKKIPSAIDCYKNEAQHILGMLESMLSKQEWLVGRKFTVADVSFVPWNNALTEPIFGPGEFDFEKEFPKTYVWHTKVLTTPPVAKVSAERARKILEEQEKMASANRV